MSQPHQPDPWRPSTQPPGAPPAGWGGVQPAPPPGYYYGQPIAQRQTTNGFAVASMVLGILWIYWIGSILALVFGYKAKREIDASNGTQSGRGMAVAGIVLGWIGVATAIVVLIAIIVAAANGNNNGGDTTNTGMRLVGALVLV